MASKEIAAMLDALMGRGRNLEPGAEFKAPSWEDDGVCRYFLVQFCPHDLFTNTKADLGACPDAHDPDIKEAYTQAKHSRKKEDFEEEFLRFSQRLLSDVAMKIKRSKERLLLDQREQLAANGISPAQQEEIEMKVEILTEKINGLVEKAEEAGNQGDVEEAQGILKLSDQLKEEREELKQTIGAAQSQTTAEGHFGPPKAMEVCETCGAFLIVGDAQARIDDHLMGKLHVGYARLRASVDQMLEDRAKKREEREKAEKEEGKKRSEERSNRDERKRSRSRERKRSRSRDRGRRDRSRGRRDRSRDSRGRRDRSREKRDRSRDRDRRGEDRKERRHRSRERRSSRSRDRSR